MFNNVCRLLLMFSNSLFQISIFAAAEITTYLTISKLQCKKNVYCLKLMLFKFLVDLNQNLSKAFQTGKCNIVFLFTTIRRTFLYIFVRLQLLTLRYNHHPRPCWLMSYKYHYKTVLLDGFEDLQRYIFSPTTVKCKLLVQLYGSPQLLVPQFQLLPK